MLYFIIGVICGVCFIGILTSNSRENGWSEGYIQGWLDASRNYKEDENA